MKQNRNLIPDTSFWILNYLTCIAYFNQIKWAISADSRKDFLDMHKISKDNLLKFFQFAKKQEKCKRKVILGKTIRKKSTKLLLYIKENVKTFKNCLLKVEIFRKKSEIKSELLWWKMMKTARIFKIWRGKKLSIWAQYKGLIL